MAYGGSTTLPRRRKRSSCRISPTRNSSRPSSRAEDGEMASREEAGTPQRYCRNCGAQARPGSRFCGVCGNRIAPVTPEDPQVIPEPVVAAQGAATRRRRRPLALVSVAGIVLVLLVGGGALAFAGLGLRFGSVSP